MANIEFDEKPLVSYRSSLAEEAPRGLTNKFISWGIASNRKQAEIILLIIAIVAVVLSVFILRLNSQVNVMPDPDKQVSIK